MPTPEIDINKIIVDLVAQTISNTFLSSAAAVAGKLSRIKVGLQVGFKKYLTLTRERASTIKTLLYRDRPVPLLDYYVTLYFKYQNRKLDDYTVILKISNMKRLVITGTAGSGKSIFIKYLLISLIASGTTGIPLFVELRHLNNLTENDLLKFIYHSINIFVPSLTQEAFEHGLTKGAFTLLLDGFDELNYTDRQKHELALLALTAKYPNLIVVISSRPDECFGSWEKFHVVEVLPMAKEQVLDLLGRLDYDLDVKKKFISEVKKQLYDKHKSFLSNPLLATMMLLTFEQFAEIPNKMHVFYEQAFDTLYLKHDALKASYKRKTFTGLSIDDFKRVFSTFCLITYFEQKFSFEEADILASIRKSLSVAKANADASAFLRDLLESVCLMQKEGIYYNFTHRSFQEYFCAYFISRSSDAEAYRAAEKLSRRVEDNVLGMLMEINKDLLEEHWILPRLNDVVSIMKNIDERKSPVEYAIAFGTIAVMRFDSEWRVVWSQPRQELFVIYAILNLYPGYMKLLHDPKDRHDSDNKVLSELMREKPWENSERYQGLKKVADAAEEEAPESKRRRNLAQGFIRAPIDLDATDNSWFQKTNMAERFSREKKVLLKLRDEVSDRVRERKEQLQDIFDPSKPGEAV